MYDNQENPKSTFGLMVSGVALTGLLAVGTLFGLAGLTKINPGEVGILVKLIGSDRGMQEETLDTGFRWVNPFTYDVEVYDVRFKQYEMYDTAAETKDGQPVILDLSYEIGLQDAAVPQLHETVGHDWYEQVFYPRARTAVRNATSAQLSEEIYTSEGRQRIRDAVAVDLEPLRGQGLNYTVNVRSLQFKNPQFVAKLEAKAAADQDEEIQRREAKAAEQQAIKVANVAEGQKQVEIKKAEANNAKRILEAEAHKEELRLQGEGQRLQQEEQAKGILAIAKAKAEGTRLQVLAYGSGETYASVKWAENVGPNIKVYGVPTGAEGTNSIMDLTGALSGMAALKGTK